MSEKGYQKRAIRVHFGDGTDTIRVLKSYGSNQTSVELEINGKFCADLALRGRDKVAQLHALLGHLLREGE